MMKDPSLKKLTAKEDRFVDEYLINLDPYKSAVTAGFSESVAKSKAYQWVSNGKVKPHVFEEIKRRKEKRSERKKIDQDFVLEYWAKMVTADANELTSVRVSACRYCHGNDHGYQWRTRDEFEIALEAYLDLPDERRAKKSAPVESGGYGYSRNLDPVETCPNCDGYGHQRTVLGDTTKLSPEALSLYAGVKDTQHGVEVKMHSKMGALDNLAKHLGMFPNKVELTGKDGGPIEQITTATTPQDAAAAYMKTLESDDSSDEVQDAESGDT